MKKIILILMMSISLTFASNIEKKLDKLIVLIEQNTQKIEQNGLKIEQVDKRLDFSSSKRVSSR